MYIKSNDINHDSLDPSDDTFVKLTRSVDIYASRLTSINFTHPPLLPAINTYGSRSKKSPLLQIVFR